MTTKKELIKVIQDSIETAKKYRDDPKVRKLYLKSDSDARNFVFTLNSFIDSKNKELQNLLSNPNEEGDFSFSVKCIKEVMYNHKVFYEHILYNK